MNALITGASRGIGLAVAREFDEKGNLVFISARDAERLNAAAASFQYADAVALPCDAGDFDAVRAMFESIDAIGGVNVLVNNAGVSYRGLFQDTPLHERDSVIDTNVKGVLNCSRFASVGMIRRERGVIVNISSIWGLTGASCEVVYSMTKGAVNAFTKALAKELAPSGVRVNAVAAGVIDTGMNGFLSEGERAELAAEIPMGRFGTAGEIAKTVKFLCSDDASYITGQIIAVDGGLT